MTVRFDVYDFGNALKTLKICFRGTRARINRNLQKFTAIFERS